MLRSQTRATKSLNPGAEFSRAAFFRFWVKLVAGVLGFEPRQAESESAVLPLDDPPKPGKNPFGTARLDQPAAPFKDAFGRLLLLPNLAPYLAIGIGRAVHVHIYGAGQKAVGLCFR